MSDETEVAPFLFELLEEGDIPKALLGKIPDGMALVSVEDVHEKFNTMIEAFMADNDQLLSQTATRFGIGGLIVGVGLGAVGGYFIARRLLETKYHQIADDEIAEMQSHYRSKTVALENTVAKPQLEEIVREQGYSTVEPPMAVTPPSAVVKAAEDARDDEEKRPSVSEVIETPENEVQNVFQQNDPQPEDGWDYHTERSRRSPLRPYVIHRDEKDENEVYDVTTYTYYETDDVLCNERDEVIARPERDTLVGEANLEKFGHGSGDPSIVYIRNDRLEMMMEVIRSPNSFAEEVHGFQHTDYGQSHSRRERSSFDDEE